MKRYDECGYVKLAKQSSRPRKLKDGDIRELKRELGNNCHALLVELCGNMSTSICMNTLQKEIHELGVNNCIAIKKSFLNDHLRHK